MPGVSTGCTPELGQNGRNDAGGTKSRTRGLRRQGSQKRHRGGVGVHAQFGTVETMSFLWPKPDTREYVPLRRSVVALWAAAIAADGSTTLWAVLADPALGEANAIPAMLVGALEPSMGRVGAHVALVAVATVLCTGVVYGAYKLPATRFTRAVLVAMVLSGVLKLVISANNAALALGSTFAVVW